VAAVTEQALERPAGCSASAARATEIAFRDTSSPAVAAVQARFSIVSRWAAACPADLLGGDLIDGDTQRRCAPVSANAPRGTRPRIGVIGVAPLPRVRVPDR
jgi:hypothetical protein